MAFDFFHKGFNQPNGKLVHPVVVVAVLRILAIDFEIDHNSLFVAHGINFGVFNRRKTVRRAGKPCNARCKEAPYLSIVQRHLQSLVRILVVHIVYEVEGVYIQARKPVEHLLVLAFNLLEIERSVAEYGREHRRNLQVFARLLIQSNLVLAAVERVQQAFCKVCPRAEKLHIFAYAHTAYATRDAVIVSHFGAHQIVAFVLNSRSCN